MRNRTAVLWIWMCVLPLAWDFKAPDSQTSHLLQWLLVLPALAGAVALSMIGPRFTHPSLLRRIVSVALWLSVVGSIVPQSIQGNDVANYLRVLLPFLLFALCFTAACRPWSPIRVGQFENAMWYANVICLVFTLGFGLTVGWPLADVRYRIVSPTMLGLQGVLLHQFIAMRRYSLTTVLVFLATLVVELLSVTRSLLLGTALMALFAMWIAAPTLGHLMRVSLRLIGAVVCMAAIAGAGMLLLPQVTDHWTQRLFAAKATPTDRDPTTITRLAELRDQYDQVTSSTTTLLLGEGYGHDYRYSPIYLPDLRNQVNERDFYRIREWVAGHNFWVYQLFSGGLVFGLAMPAAMLLAVVKVAFAYRRWRRLAPREPMLAPFGRAVFMLAAVPVTSIGGNPLGARYAGVIYGIALGFSVAMYVQLRFRFRVLARRRHVAPVVAPAPMPTPLETFATPEPR
ncbi:MAG TPA: hypothetical protein VL689_06485 [Paraburkholderia sp.]|jgi:hypothetical protein|nr:hypothetical protein [Paraburkholderia sp.]